jgi:hypothetical protein
MEIDPVLRSSGACATRDSCAHITRPPPPPGGQEGAPPHTHLNIHPHTTPLKPSMLVYRLTVRL